MFLNISYYHEDPNILLLWDNVPSQALQPPWNQFFTTQSFFGKFTGMKFIIKDGLQSNHQKVGLICVIWNETKYGSKYPVIYYFNTMCPSSPANTLIVWRSLHRNYHGLNIPHICRGCMLGRNGRRNRGHGLIFVQFFVFKILISKFNITTTSEKRRLLDKHGMMTRNWVFPGENINTFFLSKASPRYVYSPYALLSQQYHLLTIMDKQQLYNHWDVLAKPVSGEFWQIFGLVSHFIASLSLTLVFFSYRTATNFSICRSLGYIILHMTGASMDQYYHKSLKKQYHVIRSHCLCAGHGYVFC